MNSLTFLAAAVAAVIVYNVYNYFFRSRPDPREPPMIPSSIPYIGHTINLMLSGSKYFASLRCEKYPTLPVYALQFGTQRMYVVNSPSLLHSLERSSKTIQFTPFVRIAAERLSNIRGRSLEQFDGSEKGEGLSVAEIKFTKHAILHSTEDLNLQMLAPLGDLLGEPLQDQGKPRKLFHWIKHAVTLASTKAAYGPLNPFDDPKVEAAFSEFESDAALLMLNIAPSITARRGCRARDIISNAFLKYYLANGHEQGSVLAKVRHDGPLEFGLPEGDIARLEVSFLGALLSNTVPTAFWMLVNALSKPELVAELRIELTDAIRTSKEEDKQTRHTIQVSHLKQNCPLLMSIYQEVLRLQSVLPNTRTVIADTLLNDQFLLRKGAIVQIPTSYIHRDTSTWGPTAREMDLRRFMPKGSNDGKGGMKEEEFVKPAQTVMRTFGGAPHICPGRHFATTEILCTVALMVLRYDIEPVGGKWVIPGWIESMFSSVAPPKEDVEVVIREREGWHGIWDFEMGDPKIRFQLALA